MKYSILAAIIQLHILTDSSCVGTISCFTCSSRNGSDPACEDPFHPGPAYYSDRCKVPKRGHIGEFPAHFCIKIKGISVTTRERLMVRRCARETMENQCGKFKLENETFEGCILTCAIDGCNQGTKLTSSFTTNAVILTCATLVLLFASSYSSIQITETERDVVGPQRRGETLNNQTSTDLSNKGQHNFSTLLLQANPIIKTHS